MGTFCQFTEHLDKVTYPLSLAWSQCDRDVHQQYDPMKVRISMHSRTVLIFFKQEKPAKCEVKNEQLKSGWGDDYLAKVVFAA